MAALTELIEAARKEDWDLVDEKIPELVKDPSVVNWAYDSGIDDEDGNVRDFAASILEKARISKERFDDMRETIYGHMGSDSNKYVRFRSAFALAAHGVGSHRDEVERVLHEAEKDEDTADIARGYLGKI